MDTREKSARLKPPEARERYPDFADLWARQTRQTQWKWKRRGVPHRVIARLAEPEAPAPAMHSLRDCSILTAPERAMEDATFREAWRIVGQVWQRANPHRKKPRLEDVKKWEALVITLRGFSPVGQSPDPTAEEPWPATGHPLH